MKVAIAIQKYAPYIAGAERQAQLLVELAAPHLHICDIVTSRLVRESPAKESANGVTIRRLPSIGVPGLWVFVNLLSSFLYFVFCGRRYDVIHILNLSPFSLGALLGAKLWGTPTLIKVGSIGQAGDVRKVLDFPFGPSIWRLFKRADRFVAPSQVVAAELRYYGVSEQCITLIPNGLGPSWERPISRRERESARAALGLPSVPIVLYVGRMSERKGIDVLVDAWKIVLGTMDGVLLLVGGGGEATSVKQRIRACGLAGSIRLLGWQTDPSAAYRGSDIFAFASQSETFGNVLAEAMAAGLTVVTTSVGLARDHIEDGRNGLTFDGTATELASKLMLAMADADLRSRLGAEAARDAVATFSGSRMAQSYLSLYDELKRGCQIH